MGLKRRVFERRSIRLAQVDINIEIEDTLGAL